MDQVIKFRSRGEMRLSRWEAWLSGFQGCDIFVLVLGKSAWLCKRMTKNEGDMDPEDEGCLGDMDIAAAYDQSLDAWIAKLYG